MALLYKSGSLLARCMKSSVSLRLASTSINTINDQIQKKKEAALLGGGEKRIKAQHKKVNILLI